MERAAAHPRVSKHNIIMNHTPLHISRHDYPKLRLLLTNALHARASNLALRNLRDELDRAEIIDPATFPADIVTMDSAVEFEDLATGEIAEYTITFPERADVDAGRMSILAPIGTALIGCRVGSTVEWSTPGGIRQLKVRRVTAPATVAGASPALHFATAAS